MVDHTRQDLVEVEAAADVAGDTAQRVGALELMADDGGRRGEPNDVADGDGSDLDRVALGLGHRVRHLAGDEQHAPGPAFDEHRAGDLPATPIGHRGAGHLGFDHDRGIGKRSAEDAERSRQLHEPQAGGASRGRAREMCPVELPYRDVDRAEVLVDHPDGGGERRARGFERVADRRSSQRRQRADKGERRAVILDRDDCTVLGGCLGQMHGAVRAAPARRLVDRVESGKEPLEVALSVAPISARIDAVVAQSAGVAPGSDGIRVHAEHIGRTRDGERRVERPGMVQVRLRQGGSPEGFVRLVCRD